MSESRLYSTIGTNSSPFYIAPVNQTDIETTRTGQGYFFMQVFGAQAAFGGPWWIGAQNLTIMSQVNLHLDETSELGRNDIRSILQTRELEKESAVQLGFSPLLIDFVPAKMKKVSVSIEYLVHTKNYLRDLAGIITDKTFLSTISFSPAGSMVAKTVSRFTEKVIDTFIPSGERKPILQFSGDFELTTEGLKEGFYVILGSHSSKNPLPTGNLKLEVAEGGLLKIDGKLVTQLSYIILKVGCVKAIRDRLQGQSPWKVKLREITRTVQDYAEDVFADAQSSAKKEFWEKKCLPELREAQALLKSDSNFLDTEIDLIYRSAYKECLDTIINKGDSRSGDSIKGGWQPDQGADRQFLGIRGNEDLESSLSQYSNDLFKARKVFREM